MIDLPMAWRDAPPTLDAVLGWAYHASAQTGIPESWLLDLIRPLVDRDEANWRLQSLRDVPADRDYISAVHRRILEGLYADE